MNTSCVVPHRLTQHRRASAVSRTLRAITWDLEQPQAWLELHDSAAPDRQICVGVTAEARARERAYRLAYRLYVQNGYVDSNRRGMMVGPFDTEPETLTLLAVDADGRDLATISLNLDARGCLPCDEVFAEEAAKFRARGLRLAEVTRLAVDSDVPQSKRLLMHLFHAVYLYAFRLHGATDLLIEVNPRHVPFYRRLMKFESAGPERGCSRVRGAAAVLLRLDLVEITQQYALLYASPSPAASTLAHTFYASFLPPGDEEAMTRYLAEHHRPMTRTEMEYFGVLDAPGILPQSSTEPTDKVVE